LAYSVKAYVWPGKRLTYDGKPLVLGPPREDEDWLPTVARTEIDIYDADFIPGASTG
jgi:hypothetical protein